MVTPRHCFGRCEVRPTARLLLIDGRAAVVGARAFDVLVALIEHRDRVVGKHELMSIVWPGVAVEDNNLQVQISALRKLIGTRAIATVARRGYRFTESLLDCPESSEAASPPRQALLGRERELRALDRLLNDSPLVTVTGAGGVGKTSLARAAIRARQQQGDMRVAWVDLSALPDAALLASQVARALDLALDPGEDSLQPLLAALAPMSVLLVLDNAEQLIDGVARLCQALALGAPRARLLVTSQLRVNLQGEQVLRLQALAVPDASAPAAEASAAGAVALFVQCARACLGDFGLNDGNVAEVIDICRRLDGMPLAIELAAARLPMFGLRGLQQRLDQRLGLLRGALRGLPARQQTLQATMDWSHALLDPAQQRSFRRLGVFAGGFPLELAAAVVDDDPCDATFVDRLAALVDQSFVAAEGDGPRRYRLLDTARLYALQRLEAAAESDSARRRHAEAMCRLGDAIAKDFVAESDKVFLQRHAPEMDNLRTALAWALEHAPEQTIVLAAAFVRIGWLLSLTSESSSHLAAARRQLSPRTPPLAVARFFVAQALLARSQPLDAALDGLRQAIVLFRQMDYPLEWLNAISAFSLRCREEHAEEAGRYLDEAQGIAAADARPVVQLQVAFGEFSRAVLHRKPADQRHWLAQSFELAVAAGHEHYRHLVRWNQGWFALTQRDDRLGDAIGGEIVAHAERTQGRPTWLANGLILRLIALVRLRSIAQAVSVAHRLAAVTLPLRRLHEIAGHAALLCLQLESPENAARLLGFGLAECARLKTERGLLDASVAAQAGIEQAIGADHARLLIEEGAHLTIDQAHDLLRAIEAPVPDGAGEAIHRFGRFELRPAQRRLSVDGRTVALGTRAYEVLLQLVESRDRVVSNGELLRAVWPGRVVEAASVQAQVLALRRLLGHDAIVTVPGFGYRWAKR